MADPQAEPSYIDYEAFLDPSFSPTQFANTLVLATNNPSDTPLDLSTPLSRVLFDVQEVDTHIDTLTTRSALPLLGYTQDQAQASKKILQNVESHVAALSEGYKRLEREVIDRYETANQVHLAAERLCQTLVLARALGRVLMFGRQLEAQMSELNSAGGSAGKREDHRATIRVSNTLLSLRQLFSASRPGQEAHGLDRLKIVTVLKNDIISPSEQKIIARATQIIREFSMSSLLASTSSSGQLPSVTSTYTETEETKSRATCAFITLYLLSPVRTSDSSSSFEPTLLISALQNYLQTAIKSSAAALARALATLPTLDRTLTETSARCQNIVALGSLLESVKPPPHPLLQPVRPSPTSESTKDAANSGTDGPRAVPSNLLSPLLSSLDTSSLPSYFWRTLAGSLSPRVQEILNRGGVSARTLRSNKDRVREAIRECVDCGSRLPLGVSPRGSGATRAETDANQARAVVGWEREAAVMISAVVGLLGR